MELQNDSTYNFADFRSNAREIDKGIQFLEKKIKVSNLGWSYNPEETKLKALNLLSEYDKAILMMKEDIEKCNSAEECVLKDTEDDMKNVNSFISYLKNEINVIETHFKTKGSYVPYQEKTHQYNDSESADHGDQLNYSDNSINGTYSVDHSDVSNGGYSFITPSSQRYCHKMSNFKLSTTKECYKYLDRSCDSVDICPVSYTRKNREDVCKTPTDPGISVTSMKLLGLSNIKTKLYRSDHVTNTYLDEK